MAVPPLREEPERRVGLVGQADMGSAQACEAATPRGTGDLQPHATRGSASRLRKPKVEEARE